MLETPGLKAGWLDVLTSRTWFMVPSVVQQPNNRLYISIFE